MDHKPADNNPDDTTSDGEVSPKEETSFSESGFDKEPTYETGGADTDGPTPETAPKADFTLPIRQPGRSKKPLYWALMAFVVVLIAAGVAFYFLVVAKPVKETPVASTSPTPTPTKVFTAESLVEEISAHLKGTPVEIAKSDGTRGDTATGQTVYQTAYYQAPDMQFKTTPLKSFGVSTRGTQEAITADYATITTFLTDHKFTSVSGETGVASGTYTSEKIVCFIDNPALSDVKTDVVGLGCADVSSYEAAATALEPFYSAYTASVDAKTHPVSLQMSAPVISDGSAGYKNASVGMNNFVGLFYQEPSKDWVFFMSVQNELSCDKFNTDVLKKSFAGQKCFDLTTNKDSVVVAA